MSEDVTLLVRTCVSHAGSLFDIAETQDFSTSFQALIRVEISKLGESLKNAAGVFQSERGRFVGLLDDIPHIGEMYCPSFHALGIEVSRELYYQSFREADWGYLYDNRPKDGDSYDLVKCELDPEIIVENWEAVKDWLRINEMKFNPAWLDTMIQKEAARATTTANARPLEIWSKEDLPSSWAKQFDMTLDTLHERIDAGLIHVNKITSKRWKVLLKDLPK